MNKTSRNQLKQQCKLQLPSCLPERRSIMAGGGSTAIHFPPKLNRDLHHPDIRNFLKQCFDVKTANNILKMLFDLFSIILS